jgi:choline kinase
VANGESIGLIRFAGIGSTLFSNVLNDMVRYQEERQIFYLAAIQRLIDDGHEVSYSECSPEDWAEIDFHPDVDLIRQRIGRKSSLPEGWE